MVRVLTVSRLLKVTIIPKLTLPSTVLRIPGTVTLARLSALIRLITWQPGSFPTALQKFRQ